MTIDNLIARLEQEGPVTLNPSEATTLLAYLTTIRDQRDALLKESVEMAAEKFQYREENGAPSRRGQ